MSKALALVVVLFFVLFCGKCYGELRVGFYKGKCGVTNVEGVVQNVVETWHFEEKEKDIAAALLRMQFHDCFVNGCDASILLDGLTSEKKAVPNSSVRGYELIDAIKEALEAECQGLVSCADIISMATRDAVVFVLNKARRPLTRFEMDQAGGKWYDVETGRRDGDVSLASNVKLPAATISVSDSIKLFASKNLTQYDMVYLLGGHTVGIARCSLFKDRIYNFNKTGGPDPTMSPWLLAELKEKCPRISLIFDNTYPLDVKTPSLVDNSYFQEIKKGNGVLQIDQQIALDELTKNIVDDIVNDPDFYTKFGEAMVKLGRVEVLIDGQGEVRKSCRVVN
ncbi:peroxidase 60-like [Solanum stenotomum]|uniref:peroxidase 60-like n=1 Tax=Solanum stenotomum TaxID=172797 RepID=UPI0020D06355|nr:peroxidase 60-like [Solanum stenotomum]